MGIVIAYNLAVTLLKPWITRKMASNAKLRDIDAAISSKGILIWQPNYDTGSYIVLLLRLSPIFPHGLCNYVFASSSIRVCL